MRLMGFIAGIMLLATGFLLGGELSHMFDPPALVIGLFTGLSFTLMGHGNDLWRALAAFFLNHSIERRKRLHYAKVLNTLRRSLFWTGFAAALIGAINMSRGMDSWEHFGPAFAVLLLSPFYGIVMAELIVAPMVSRLESEAG